MKLRSPHGLVRQYSLALQRMIHRLPDIEADERLQDIAICIFLAVTMVDAFLNAYFRRLTLGAEYMHHSEKLLKDLERRISLDGKLRTWPKLFFPDRVDRDAVELQAFHKLKERRNTLMHFHAEPGVLRLGNQGVWMIDSQLYDNLEIRDAVDAANISYALMKYLIAFWQASAAEVEQHLWMWTATRARRD